MASVSSNTEPLTDGGPRKRKAPLNANGDPVGLDKAAPRKKPKASAPAKSAAKSATKKRAPTVAAKPAGPPRTRSPSVDIEDVIDEDAVSRSVPPRNPQNILEASDGSDDEPMPSRIQRPRRAEPAMDNADDIEMVNDPEDEPEEDAEAELSVSQFSTIKKMLTSHQNVSCVNGPHQFTCSSGQHPASNILMTVELMCSNVLPGGARERTERMSAASSTKVTENPPATFVSMPKFAGVPTRLKWQTKPVMLMPHARSCPRLICEMGQSLLNLPELERGKSPSVHVSIQRLSQGTP